MKHIFFLAIILIFCQNLSAQAFEGYIQYKYTYVNASGDDITAQVAPTMGSEQNYYIKGDKYIGIDENGRIAQLYIGSINTYYYENKESIKSIPADIEFPENIIIKQSEEEEKVLNYTCKSVVIETEIGETTYFFTSKVSVDLNNFRNHNFGGWSKYLKESNGALPLKFISKKKAFTQIAEAVKIVPQDVNEDIFKLENHIEPK